jgi:4-amino-4-deoxy-L-arabinose transferase-like glycosyltransferase
LQNQIENANQISQGSRFFSKSVPISPQTIIIIILAIAATALKFYLLFERLLFIDPDEGYYLILARNLIAGNGYTFNGLPNVVFPPFLPLLIAFFYLICQDFQFSLIFITAISGGLLGIVSYKIAQKKFSAFIPVLCAFLVFFIYQLNAFLPLHSKPYVYVLYRGSDILNCFLIITSVFLVLRLVEKDKYLFAIMAGGFFALSYLTRPEGLLLFLMILVCLVFLKILSLASISYKKIFVFLLAFLLFTSPYILYLKNTTGKWSLSGKISTAKEHRESLLDVIKNDNWSFFSKVHYSFNKENMEMNQVYWGFHDKIKADEKTSIGYFFNIIFENLKMYPIIPKVLLPLDILIFFLVGLSGAVHKIIKRKSAIDIILFIFFPYSLLITALSYPIPRHHLFLVPVFCIYAVEGIVMLSSFLAKNKNVLKNIILTLLFLIIVLFMGLEYKNNLSLNYLKIPSFRKSLEVDSFISEYLKKRRAQTVMSVHPSFAVRAISDWQVLPQAPLVDIIRFGKHKDVDYIVLPDPNQRENFYYIVDLRNSYIPTDSGDKFGYVIIEKSEYFQLINIVKKQ